MGQLVGQPRVSAPAQLLSCKPKRLPGEAQEDIAATLTAFQELCPQASPAQPGMCSGLAHGLLALELTLLGSEPGELAALFTSLLLGAGQGCTGALRSWLLPRQQLRGPAAGTQT